MGALSENFLSGDRWFPYSGPTLAWDEIADDHLLNIFRRLAEGWRPQCWAPCVSELRTRGLFPRDVNALTAAWDYIMAVSPYSIEHPPRHFADLWVRACHLRAGRLGNGAKVNDG